MQRQRKQLRRQQTDAEATDDAEETEEADDAEAKQMTAADEVVTQLSDDAEMQLDADQEAADKVAALIDAIYVQKEQTIQTHSARKQKKHGMPLQTLRKNW